jgi:hypothetical protein
LPGVAVAAGFERGDAGAQQGQLGDELLEDRLEPAPGGVVGAGGGCFAGCRSARRRCRLADRRLVCRRRPCLREQHEVDRAVLEMPAPTGEERLPRTRH